MITNVGSLDRLLRITLGLGLLAWATLGGGPLWAWVGIVPLATGALGWCPAYMPFGISTCRTKKA